MKVSVTYGPNTDQAIQQVYSYIIKVYREEMRKKQLNKEENKK